MSEKETRKEMEEMRQRRDSTTTGKREAASDKAQATREARQAKMANKETSEAPAAASELPEAAPPVPVAAFLGEHTVASGDTLTHIAQKYYNSTARDKWMAIYEANKETIGSNPSLIRVGQVLKIPALSD